MAALALFDLDNTLLDRAGAVRAWIEDFARERELPLGAVPWMVEADGDGFVSRRDFLDLVGKRFDLGWDPDAEVAGLRSAVAARIRPAADAVESLELLRREGWRIGIVTNGSPVQEDKIRQTGLDRLVDGWAVSGIENVRKPDPGLFAIAARRAGASLADAWMIGDSAAADIGGAVAAEIDSIWLHRQRVWELGAFRPTRIAFSVSDAVTMLLEPDLHLPDAVPGL